MRGSEGIAGVNSTVFDMQLLAGVNGDDIKAGVAAASPGPGEAVRRFETGVAAQEEISIWSSLGSDIGFEKSSLRSNAKSSVAD